MTALNYLLWSLAQLPIQMGIAARFLSTNAQPDGSKVTKPQDPKQQVSWVQTLYLLQ